MNVIPAVCWQAVVLHGLLYTKLLFLLDVGLLLNNYWQNMVCILMSVSHFLLLGSVVPVLNRNDIFIGGLVYNQIFQITFLFDH